MPSVLPSVRGRDGPGTSKAPLVLSLFGQREPSPAHLPGQDPLPLSRFYPCPPRILALSAAPLALPHSPTRLLTLTLASPSACPVLFCTSLLPGDRPTKNSPCSLSRPQLPKEQEMRGAGRPMSCSPPQTPSPKSGPALQPGASANLAISRASHTPSLGGGLPRSAYNQRAVLTPREEERGGQRSRGKPSQFLKNQCQPHCGHRKGRAWLH